MTELYAKNLRLLGSVNPKWPIMVETYVQDEMRAAPVRTSSGMITFRVKKNNRMLFMHSRYDPEKEARQFIESKKIKPGDVVVVYGFGLGYHIQELLKSVGDEGKVYIIEPNIYLFREALKYIDLSSFISDKRLNLSLNNDIENICLKLTELFNEIQNNRGRLLIHHSSLELTPDYARSLKQVLQEWQTEQDTVVRYAGLLEENLKQNINLIKSFPGATRLLSKFNDVPVLLVAAGPSLDESITYIHLIRDKCLIFAVGTALRPLIGQGIDPDLIIITDPHPIVYQQIEGVQTKAPLIVFPTVHPTVLKNYYGPRIIAYQYGVDIVETMAGERGEQLIDTGGSVVTAALDIAIRMGCNPILFAGLDLSYVRGKTHATGTMHGELVIKEDPSLIEIISNRQKIIQAPPNLTIFRKWIEQRVEKTGARTKFFNLSPEGAMIKGAPYMTWDEAIEFLLPTEQKNAKEDVDKICSA